MFQQVLNYAGEYRKTTYLSIAVMLSRRTIKKGAYLLP